MLTSTNLFRTAFWAMLLSFGLTMIVVVSDPKATNAIALHSTRTSGHERIATAWEPPPMWSEDRPHSGHLGLTEKPTLATAETRREAPRSHHAELAGGDLQRPSSQAIYRDGSTRSSDSVTRMAQLTRRRPRPTRPQRTTTAATASMARQKNVVPNAQQDRSDSLPRYERQKTELPHRAERDITSSQQSTASGEEVENLPPPVGGWRAFMPTLPVVPDPTTETKTSEQLEEQVDIETRIAQLERQIDRIVAAETDRKSGVVESTTQRLQQGPQFAAIKRQLENLIGDKTAAASLPNNLALPSEGSANGTGKSRVAKLLPNPDGVERFSLQIQDEEISRVLEMLGQLASLNIQVGGNVTGTVSTNLQGVTAEEALKGLLWSRGYSFHRDGEYVYVMAVGFAKKDPVAQE